MGPVWAENTSPILLDLSQQPESFIELNMDPCCHVVGARSCASDPNVATYTVTRQSRPHFLTWAQAKVLSVLFLADRPVGQLVRLLLSTICSKVQLSYCAPKAGLQCALVVASGQFNSSYTDICDSTVKWNIFCTSKINRGELIIRIKLAVKETEAGQWCESCSWLILRTLWGFDFVPNTKLDIPQRIS